METIVTVRFDHEEVTVLRRLTASLAAAEDEISDPVFYDGTRAYRAAISGAPITHSIASRAIDMLDRYIDRCDTQSDPEYWSQHIVPAPAPVPGVPLVADAATMTATVVDVRAAQAREARDVRDLFARAARITTPC